MPENCRPYNPEASTLSRQVGMKQSRARIFTLLISAFAFLLVAPSTFTLFSWADQGLVEISSASSAITISADLPTDLDGDGHDENIVHKNGKLEIFSQGLVVWESPQEWQITQAEITDFNQDDIPEVTLLVWREFSPWPIDAYIPHPGRTKDFHDQENRSCHLILIGFGQGTYRELWAGSALADPLLAFTSADLDQDGYQELVALESRYNAHIFERSSLTIWEWNGFGFTLLSRGPQGYFPSIVTVQTSNGQELLLTQGIFRR